MPWLKSTGPLLPEVTESHAGGGGGGGMPAFVQQGASRSLQELFKDINSLSWNF